MTIVAKQQAYQPNLVIQRLHAVLAIFEREKPALDCHWLYLCARQQGEKLRAVWLAPDEITLVNIEHSLGDFLLSATSFEIELLHSPEVRYLNPSAKNQWNSLRGITAMEVSIGGKTTRWAALEMLARNFSFSSALARHLAELKQKDELPTSIPVTLYQTKQWFCDNSQASNNHPAPIELFRGNRVVDIETINSDSVLRCAQAMTRWLAAQVDESGAANYKYWPSRGAYASSNNAIRQWMATVCLGRAARSFGSKQLASIASKNLEHNIVTTYRNNGDQSYIWMNGSAKLGAAALAALAILESPKRKQYLNEEYALHSMIYSLSNADGSFDTFYKPRERKDNQNFYSGEALLFLAARYSVSRNPEELKHIMAAFQYYRTWHLQNRNPAFVPWHTQAYFLVWKITKDEGLKDFIFEMNDWLLSMQQWNSAEFPDMQGRFYDPARAYFGPPHASSTGVYLEGLIDAFSIAKELGDQQRVENYRIAIVRGTRSLIQLQYKDAVDCFYIKHVDRVLGGVRTTVYDNTIRIDNVQHGLMALLKILSRFSVSDYQLGDLEDHEHLLNNSLGYSSRASTQNVARTELWLCGEALNACAIKWANNDHAWKAQKVIARTTRPENGSLYFARQSASEELKLLHQNHQQPSAIFAEGKNAKILSSELSIPIYKVVNLLETARSLADAARLRTPAKIIGVTGSVGKTSVKDALSHVLSTQGATHSTEANANDGWGVLETLMNLPLDARFAVMELGMLGVGSIKIKSQRVKPHVGIITNIHDAHLSYHGDESSIAHTKSGLLDGLVPGGVAVLPRDSAWYDFLKGKAAQVGVGRTITFGKHPKADFRLVKSVVECGNNIVHASFLGKPVAFQIGVSGDHWGLNAMAILAAVHAAEADVEAGIRAMPSIKPSFRRGEIHTVEVDSKSYTLIDDTWNACPTSVVAALKNLKNIATEESRKILFIGDMLQLGKNESQKHVELVDAIVASSIDKVFTVGELSESLFQALPSALRGQHFPDAATVSIVAKEIVDKGDVALIKGSNAMEMWRVVRALREVSTSNVIGAAQPARTRREGVAI
jgi:UDP-N-acetylmuramoyl-tripeptide--D-alanyl-D-alanine ligase